MEKHEFRGLLLRAGLPEDQIDSVLDHFLIFGYASKIMSLSDHTTATSTYARMDAYLDPQDTYTPVGRYLVSLGAEIIAWEDRTARLNLQPLLRPVTGVMAPIWSVGVDHPEVVSFEGQGGEEPRQP
ncbi:hypothetical protein PANO111632_20115 [Paracoccus nototheniae]|uniref:Uncharacterized protein n=1 Tax=Paracoccus nototheniae TaxID=2489002 RepID=A0ABW4E3D2_9RHOB|nr:hypothetical protein [Paracoccus nototheniae]